MDFFFFVSWRQFHLTAFQKHKIFFFVIYYTLHNIITMPCSIKIPFFPLYSNFICVIILHFESESYVITMCMRRRTLRARINCHTQPQHIYCIAYRFRQNLYARSRQHVSSVRLQASYAVLGQPQQVPARLHWCSINQSRWVGIGPLKARALITLYTTYIKE